MRWGRWVLVGVPLLAAAIISAGCGDSETTVRSGQPASRAAAVTAPPDAEIAAGFEKQRHALVREIELYGSIKDERVLAALRRVPRHEFVRAEYLDEAYENRPLPIGQGQTISQPLVVALMTEALQIRSGDRVLEVGTGSGYQAAVLAELGAEVYSVEIIASLAPWAQENLARAGYDGVQVRAADGYFGWEEHQPYAAIIVTAAPDHVPQSLVRQLAIGGHMVVPVGPPGFYQTLWLIERDADGVRSTNLGSVSFVPLTGEGLDEGG
jgi:protein-L-isoaspartate(D-aspartate) O-methyltransferase